MAIAIWEDVLIHIIEGIAGAQSFETCCRLMVHRLNWGVRFTGAAMAELGPSGSVNELGRFGLPGDPKSYQGLSLLSSGPITESLKKLKPIVIPDIRKTTLHQKLEGLPEYQQFAALVLLPIQSEGVPIGLVALLTNEPGELIRIPEQDARILQAMLALSMRALKGAEGKKPDFRSKSLTERELFVLEQIALGKTNKEIAPELSLSVASVKAIVQRILRKLDATSRKEAVKIFSNSHN